MKSLTKVRPHPGPLPQERENHSPVAGEFGCVRIIERPTLNSNETEMERRAAEFYKSADVPSLSPGERAGVRASVTSIAILLLLLICPSGTRAQNTASDV